MALPTNVTNPGLVNAADQAFDGLPVQVPPVGATPASASATTASGGGSSVDGPITDSLALEGTPSDVSQTTKITPASAAVTNLRGDAVSVGSPPADTLAAAGTPSDVNQTVGVGAAQNAGASVDGGTFSPRTVNTIEVTQNNVAGQRYGTGTPQNVFV